MELTKVRYLKTFLRSIDSTKQNQSTTSIIQFEVVTQVETFNQDEV